MYELKSLTVDQIEKIISIASEARSECSTKREVPQAIIDSIGDLTTNQQTDLMALTWLGRERMESARDMKQLLKAAEGEPDAGVYLATMVELDEHLAMGLEKLRLVAC